MIFENEKIYKTLKKIWMYGIPAVAYLWSKLIDIWSIPCGEPIFYTIVAVWGAMAIFLGISKYNYMNAKKIIEESEEFMNNMGVDAIEEAIEKKNSQEEAETAPTEEELIKEIKEHHEEKFDEEPVG